MSEKEEQFFDINKLPPQEGLLIFLISMNRTHNKGQNPETCWEQINHFHPHKVQTTHKNAKVGAIFLYSDFLYLNSNSPAKDLKQKYTATLNKHKNGFTNLMYKDPFLIKDAFSFKSWAQLYLDYTTFVDDFQKIKNIYSKDKKFQKYIKEDFENLPKGKYSFDDNQIDFFLEEFLVFYLISKQKIRFENNFILGHEKWVLLCYPGKPMKSHIYLYKLNPFKISNEKNKYESCWYDLEEKKLYDFDKIDLEKYIR